MWRVENKNKVSSRKNPYNKALTPRGSVVNKRIVLEIQDVKQRMKRTEIQKAALTVAQVSDSDRKELNEIYDNMMNDYTQKVKDLKSQLYITKKNRAQYERL